ncbi:MAG: hypothetical protein ACT4OT_06390 [Acidobacteriota bacterium]
MGRMKANCPDITVWRNYCDGSTAHDERLSAESHLASCHRCRHQLIALFDEAREAHVEPAHDALKGRALRLAPQKVKRPFFASFRPFAPVALAAAVVLAVGISFLLYRDRTGTPSPTDLRQSSGATAEIPLSNPPNAAQLETGTIEFRWGDSTSEARYQLTLTDEKGDIVFQEPNARSPLRLDSGALKLSSQRKYYWSVTAKLPDGTLRESPIASFTIK